MLSTPGPERKAGQEPLPHAGDIFAVAVTGAAVLGLGAELYRRYHDHHQPQVDTRLTQVRAALEGEIEAQVAGDGMLSYAQIVGGTH